MEALKSYSTLVESDLADLSAETREKLLIAFDTVSFELQNCKAELQKNKVDSDSASQELTDQLDNLKHDFEQAQIQASQSSQQYTELEHKYQELIAEKQNNTIKLDELVSQNNVLSVNLASSESEKDILTEQHKFKLNQCIELSEEINQLKSEIENCRKLKRDALFKLEDVASREATLKAQELRWTEDIAGLQRHISWLEERLQETSEQLQTARRDVSQKCSHLEAELNLKSTELEHSKATLQRLQESVDALTQANEGYIEKLKIVADEQVKVEQLYNNELDARKKLVTLYKEQLDETSQQNDQLSSATRSMQDLLKQSYDTVARLKSEQSQLSDQLGSEREKSSSKITNLESELKQSRQLLDSLRFDGMSESDLRQLNPSVAATLSALKRGHSLTQLYADYCQLVEQRDQLQLDNDRLNEYVAQLVGDLKESAPVVKDQLAERKRLLSQLDALRTQLESTETNLKQQIAQRTDLQRRSAFYQRESNRLRRTCGDLSSQVQTLLRQLEVSQGTVITDSPSKTLNSSWLLPNDDKSQLNNSAQFSSLLNDIDQQHASHQIISSQLVSFTSLIDMQQQNAKLLCVARDLADQLEVREKEEANVASNLADLTNRVDQLTSDLELAQLTAREAELVAKSASQQRDQYRTIVDRYKAELPPSARLSIDSAAAALETADSAEPDSTGAAAASSSPIPKPQQSPPDAALASTAAALVVDKLQDELQRYRQDKIESDQVYQRTIDELRKEAHEARILNQKLASQLDFTHEKLRTLEANIGGYKQEINVLREMNARYSTSAASIESEMTRLRDDLVRLEDRKVKLDVELRHAQSQLEASRAGESRWRQEAEAVRRQEQLHQQLMHQLDSIQGSLDHRESVDRRSLDRRNSQLESQLSESQTAFSELSATFKSTKATLKHELELAASQLADRDRQLDQLKIELSSVQSSLDEAVSASSSSRLPDQSNIDPDVRMVATELNRESEAEVRRLSSLVARLESSLASTQSKSEKMQELASSAEQRLSELTTQSEEVAKADSEELERIRQRCVFLESQLDLEKDERQKLVSENIHTVEEAHKMNSDLRKQIADLQSNLETTQTRCESALEVEASAKSVIASHEQVAREAQAKYEYELTLHAKDVELLSETRRQTDQLKSQLSNLELESTSFRSRLETSDLELSNQTQSWQDRLDQSNAKAEQLIGERDLLQEQIIKLTQQLVSLRRSLEIRQDSSDSANLAPLAVSGTSSTSGSVDQPAGTTSDQDADDEGKTDLKTSEDLLQIVNYLRRQKNIAQTELDESSAEVSRLLLRVNSLQQQLDQSREDLATERHEHEHLAASSGRHSELMSRLEQLNVVTESNRLLRQERDTLRTNLGELQEKLTQSQSQLGPLKDEAYLLNGRIGILSNERQSLEDERDRWRDRCNKLLETAQRMDPEQYRIACNERDELQVKLQQAESEARAESAASSQLRDELASVRRDLNSQLEEMTNRNATLEDDVSQERAKSTDLESTLESKETTIAKLREIGRKYRQETETLRRQLTSNRSGEAQLQTTNEALVEAQANLVNLRSELANCRTELNQVNVILTDSVRLVVDTKSQDHIRSLLARQGVVDDDSSSVDSTTTLPDSLQSLLTALGRELVDCQRQLNDQHERLLRMQLVESQLTKALRESTELRSRLSELHSTNAGASTSTPAVALIEPEPTTIDTGSIWTTTNIDASSSSPASATQQQAVVPPTCWSNRPLTSSTTVANIQPLASNHQLASSMTPPSSTTVIIGGKQTAEIRPITTNIATVVPTPAPQTVFTATTPSQPDPITSLQYPSSASPFTTVTSTTGAEPSTSFQLFHPVTTSTVELLRPSSQPPIVPATSTSGLLRPGFIGRVTPTPNQQQSLFAPSQLLTSQVIAATVPSILPISSSSSSSSATPATLTVGVAPSLTTTTSGVKRRISQQQQQQPTFSDQATESAVDVSSHPLSVGGSTGSSSNTGDDPFPPSSTSTTTTAVEAPDAKRPRQTIVPTVVVQQDQSSSSVVSIELPPPTQTPTWMMGEQQSCQNETLDYPTATATPMPSTTTTMESRDVVDSHPHQREIEEHSVDLHTDIQHDQVTVSVDDTRQEFIDDDDVEEEEETGDDEMSPFQEESESDDEEVVVESSEDEGFSHRDVADPTTYYDSNDDEDYDEEEGLEEIDEEFEEEDEGDKEAEVIELSTDSEGECLDSKNEQEPFEDLEETEYNYEAYIAEHQPPADKALNQEHYPTPVDLDQEQSYNPIEQQQEEKEKLEEGEIDLEDYVVDDDDTTEPTTNIDPPSTVESIINDNVFTSTSTVGEATASNLFQGLAKQPPSLGLFSSSLASSASASPSGGLFSGFRQSSFSVPAPVASGQTSLFGAPSLQTNTAGSSGPMTGEAAARQSTDDATAKIPSFTGTGGELPTTTAGRPKIQPIVWDSPRPAGSSATLSQEAPSSSTSTGPPPSVVGTTRRKLWGSSSGASRGLTRSRLHKQLTPRKR